MLKLGVKHLQLLDATPGSDGIPGGGAQKEPKSDLARSSPTGTMPAPLSPDKEEAPVLESFEIYERETEIILPCYIMMLDLVLKQVSTCLMFVCLQRLTVTIIKSFCSHTFYITTLKVKATLRMLRYNYF